jgi:predicted O-methyltransferase YrrM
MTRDSLVAQITALGSDSTTMFGGAYDGGVWLQQSPEEYADFILFLLQEKAGGRSIEAFLEIGSATGGNVFCLNALVGPFKSIVVVDNNRHERFHHRPNVLRDLPRVEVIGDSLDDAVVGTVRDIANNLQRFDVIFIDADHTYDAVRRDLIHYGPCAKPGGLIVLHDSLSHSDVRRFVSELRTDGGEYGVEFLAEFALRHGIAVLRRTQRNDDDGLR